MSYIKAEDILPLELLRQLQQYADGTCIYIPRKAENRQSRGCGPAYRAELWKRNEQIRHERRMGLTTEQLSEKYHLSEKSIGRILREGKS